VVVVEMVGLGMMERNDDPRELMLCSSSSGEVKTQEGGREKIQIARVHCRVRFD